MRDKFITANFELDLRDVQVTYVEQNQRFKDTFFTKYSFPFEFYLNRDLKVMMGNYTNLNALNLVKKHEGFHVVEGKVRKGLLEILEVKGVKVRAQIDSGYENLPNFDKKLSELPYKKITVANIYEHAEMICKKKYPEVNYNFPRVIYKKHDSKEEGWELFNQYLNDRRDNNFVNNNELEQEGVGTKVKNRNIIHPMPYLLYILKVGFADAGFELEGDILTDKDFLQRVVFCDKANYITKNSESISISMSDEDIKETDGVALKYIKSVNISERGKYRLRSNMNISGHLMKDPFLGFFFVDFAKIEITLNGVVVYSREGSHKGIVDFSFDCNKDNSNLKVKIVCSKGINIFDGTIAKSLFFKGNDVSSFLIYNKDEVDISKVVPDITFGELVKIIKNWKNYDIDIKGSKVFMNVIDISDLKNIKNFSNYEVLSPTKTFVNKRSYKISFTDMDKREDNFDSVFIDGRGVKLNETIRKPTTDVVINGYCMPLESHKGVITAAIKKNDTSVLSLIYYDGLNNGSNTAQNPTGLMLPEILNIWNRWYSMRVQNSSFSWSFIINKNQFRSIDIRDSIFAYQQKMWIVELVKNVLNEKKYQIEVKAEVIR